MSDKSGIAWTEATWNPATGCTKISPGCKFCYAKHQVWPRLSKNPSTVYYGRKFEDVQVHPERLEQPLRWRKPRRIFVNSMSDLFHEDIPDDFIEEVFSVMVRANWHIFQVLTKRPERMRKFLYGPGSWLTHVDLVHIWLGTSVENQATATERIQVLVEVPAAVRWLSCEPLLGPVRLFHRNLLDWVVVGGESGPKARAMSPEWAQSLRNQCLNAGIPFFMKQGSQANWPHYNDFDSFPRSLQVREYPIERGEKNDRKHATS